MSKKNILDKLTVEPTQLKAAFDSEQVKALTNIKGYELVVRPYTIGKDKVGVTPDLNAEYYQAKTRLSRRQLRLRSKRFSMKKSGTRSRPSTNLHEDSTAMVKSWCQTDERRSKLDRCPEVRRMERPTAGPSVYHLPGQHPRQHHQEHWF